MRSRMELYDSKDVHKSAIFNVCRICLQEAIDAIDLFAELDESKEVLNKLRICFRIIFTEGNLPNKICNYCLSELNAANKFRNKCITSEERFLSFYKQFSDNVEHEIKNEVKDILNVSEEDCTDVGDSADFEVDSNQNTSEDTSVIGNKTEIPAVSLIISDNEKKMLKCSICERLFKKQASLLRHTSIHQNKKHIGKVTGYGATRRYHCTKCSYSTPYSQTLITHMRRHTGEKPYVCECGKRFSDSSSFLSHRRIHSDTTYFTCSTCGKQFKVNKAFRQHIKSHESPKYACDICQKVLKSRYSLRDHIRRHSNIRNFSCEDCGDTFVSSSELIHHKKKHMTEKNFVCNLCGYKTLRKGCLKVHLQRHTNDKPYKCDICEASFYTRQNARRHQQVHTRNKAFICPICLKGFTRSPALNKHLESKHGTQTTERDQEIKECLKIIKKMDNEIISDQQTEELSKNIV